MNATPKDLYPDSGAEVAAGLDAVAASFRARRAGVTDE